MTGLKTGATRPALRGDCPRSGGSWGPWVRPPATAGRSTRSPLAGLKTGATSLLSEGLPPLRPIRSHNHGSSGGSQPPAPRRDGTSPNRSEDRCYNVSPDQTAATFTNRHRAADVGLKTGATRPSPPDGCQSHRSARRHGSWAPGVHPSPPQERSRHRVTGLKTGATRVSPLSPGDWCHIRRSASRVRRSEEPVLQASSPRDCYPSAPATSGTLTSAPLPGSPGRHRFRGALDFQPAQGPPKNPASPDCRTPEAGLQDVEASSPPTAASRLV